MTKRDGPKCGAKLHGREGACSLPAGWGTNHKGYGRCRKHLGNSPNVARAAERERVEQEVRAELARLDVAPVDNPLEELQRLAGRVLAWEEVIGEKVNELTAIRYTDEHGAEQLRAEVALLERAMDRCERVLVAMARLNIDERLARVTARQASLVNDVLKGALDDLGIDRSEEEVRKVMARRLRLVAAQERPVIPGRVTDPGSS
jgi:hypothetical protein